jgi:hypothetical protein
MKTINFILGLIILALLSYLISCDVMDTNSGKAIDNNYINNNGKMACNADPFRCTIPSSCNNGKGEHICLSLVYGDTEEEFNYSSIRKAKVWHVGRDCDSNLYYCSYITTDGNPQSMGCVLPWCNNNCSYTRTVCLVTYDNVTYTGSVQFSYANYNGAVIHLYESQAVCDFEGDIERNDN